MRFLAKSDQSIYEIPFARQADAEAELGRFEAADRAGIDQETPDAWEGVDVYVPDGWIAPSPRRLSLVGEQPVDRALRDIRDEPGFGTWLFATDGFNPYTPHQNGGEKLSLFWALDEDANPYAFSANEVQKFLDVRRTEDGPVPHIVSELVHAEASDAGSADPGADERKAYEDLHPYEWLRPYFERMRDRFLLARLRDRVDSKLSASDLAHRCGDAYLAALSASEDLGVYFVRSRAPVSSAVAIKIGWAKNVRLRIQALATAHPWPLDLLAIHLGGSVRDEHDYHRQFRHLNLADAPGREWFRPGEDLLAEIRRVRELMAAHQGGRLMRAPASSSLVAAGAR